MEADAASDNELLAALVARGTSYSLADTAVARATIPQDRLYRLGDGVLPAARRMPDLSLNAGRQAMLRLFPEAGEPVAPRAPRAPKGRPRSTGGAPRYGLGDTGLERTGRSLLGTERLGESARPGSRAAAVEMESSEESDGQLPTAQQLVDPRDLIDVPAPRVRLGVDRSFKTLVSPPNAQTTPYTPSPLADVGAYQKLVDAAKRFDVELSLKGAKRALVYHNLVAVSLRQQKTKYPLMAGLRRWPDTLGFDARFEAGNLFSAARYVGTNVYELLVNPDFDTCDHTGWFYFCMGNVKAGVRYTFKLKNFIKERSVYEKGMRIACLRGSTRDTIGWHMAGESVCYYGNNLPRKGEYFYKEIQDYYVNTVVEEEAPKRGSTAKRAASASATGGAKAKPKAKPKKKQASKNIHDVSGSYFTLSFELEFDTDEDEVFLAASVPYTYSDLNRYLANLKPRAGVSVERLCKTIYENNCPVVKITSGTGPNAYAGKDVMLIVGREHPGDHTSSWCVQGILDWFSGRRDAEVLGMLTGRAQQSSADGGPSAGLMMSSAFGGNSFLASAVSTPMAAMASMASTTASTPATPATPMGPMTPSGRAGRARSRQRFGQSGRLGGPSQAGQTGRLQDGPPPSLPEYPLPHTPLPAPLEWTHDSRHDIKQDLYQGQLLRSFLLERYVIVVVPMLAIDGVIMGNTRTDTSAQAVSLPEAGEAKAAADTQASGAPQTAEARAAALAKTLDPNRGNPRPVDLHRSWETCTGLSAPTVYATRQLFASFLERKGCRAAAVLNVEACGAIPHHTLYTTETAPQSELKELFWRVCGRQGVIPNLPLPALADFLAASKEARPAAPDGAQPSARGRTVMFNASNIVLGAYDGPTLSQLITKSKARAAETPATQPEPERRNRSQGQDRGGVDRTQALQAAIFGTTSADALMKPEADPDAIYHEFEAAFHVYCGTRLGSEPDPASRPAATPGAAPGQASGELNVTPQRTHLFREYVLPHMLEKACAGLLWRARLGFPAQGEEGSALAGTARARAAPTSALAGTVFEATPRGEQSPLRSFRQLGASTLSTSCLASDPPKGRLQEGANPFSHQGCRYAHLTKRGTLLSQVLDSNSRPPALAPDTGRQGGGAMLAAAGSLGRPDMYCPNSYSVATSVLQFATQGPWSSLLFGDTIARQLAVYYDSNGQVSRGVLQKMRETFLSWVRFSLKYCATGSEDYFTAFEMEKLPLSLRTKIRDRGGVFAGLECRTEGEYAKAYQINSKLDRTKVFQFLDPLDYAFCAEDSDDSEAPVYQMTEKELKGLEKAKSKEERLQEKREKEELRSNVHGMVLAVMNPKRLKEEQERALRKDRKGKKGKKGKRASSAKSTGAVVPQITLSSLMGQGTARVGGAAAPSGSDPGAHSGTQPASLHSSRAQTPAQFASATDSARGRVEASDAPPSARSTLGTRAVTFKDATDSLSASDATGALGAAGQRQAERGDQGERSQSSLAHMSQGNHAEDTEDTDKAFLGGKEAPAGPVGGVRFQLDMSKVQRG